MPRARKPCWVRGAKQIMPYVEKALDKLGFSRYEVKPSGFDIDEGQDEGILIGRVFTGVYSDQDFENEFERLYPGEILPNMAGLALREEWNEGLDEILLREGTFCSVLSIVGHELGHVLTKEVRDEEEKAYAFQFAWLDALNNIVDHPLGLRMKASLRLSKTGSKVHQEALKFVKNLVNSGYKPLQLYRDISKWKVRNWENSSTYGKV